MANEVTFPEGLKRMWNRSEFPDVGGPMSRWGQMLREKSEIKTALDRAVQDGKLVRLGDLVRVRSGVVTRANAYFILKELSFDEIPARLRVTRGDLERFGVYIDGLQTVHRIEREFMKDVIKGPEYLLSPTSVLVDNQRLFDVRVSKEELRSRRTHLALEYLRRGETTSYKVSSDSLKGGIPAQRSQIRDRRPFWYSLNVPNGKGKRLVFPEHFDRRYVVTLVEDTGPVVIDTCYLAWCHSATDAETLLSSLNSVLTWYQLELRGRTQHGEGVLKVKIPDWEGILVANPRMLADESRLSLNELFRPLCTVSSESALDAVDQPDRVAFDEAYLAAVGLLPADEWRLQIVREIRDSIGERHARKASVAEAKTERLTQLRSTLDADAYASRIVSRLEPFPDPTTLVPEAAKTTHIAITHTPDSPYIRVGKDLFSHSDVLCGDVCIAKTSSPQEAQFVRASIAANPSRAYVDVPAQPVLDVVLSVYHSDVQQWNAKFSVVARNACKGILDARFRDEIIQRARELCHAV